MPSLSFIVPDSMRAELNEAAREERCRASDIMRNLLFRYLHRRRQKKAGQAPAPAERETLRTAMDKLVATLEQSKIEHYSEPQGITSGLAGRGPEFEWTCGADEHNAAIDAALALARQVTR